MSIKNCSGTSLVEVLLATFLMVSVVVTLSLAFPKASQNLIQTRQRLVASELASAQLENVTSQPYALVDPLDGSGSCDCTAPQVFTMLNSTSTSVSGVTFQVASCVNLVVHTTPNSWTPQCASAPGGDTGYKNVMVRVTWGSGPDVFSITQQSLMMRS